MTAAVVGAMRRFQAAVSGAGRIRRGPDRRTRRLALAAGKRRGFVSLALVLFPLILQGRPRCWVTMTPGHRVATGCGEVEATQLWMVREEGGEPELLVTGHDDPATERLIAGIAGPVFSSDGRYVYFESEAWAVSGSIQRVDVRTKRVEFLIDGNSVEVVPAGPYGGDLLVVRHLIKFDREGNSLGRAAYLWLVSPEGKLLFEIGEDGGASTQRFRRRHHVPDRGSEGEGVFAK